MAANYFITYKLLISKRGSSDKISFKEFYRYFDPSFTNDPKVAFAKISEEYVKSFNSKFHKDKNNKKALTARKGSIIPKSASCIFHGIVEGGITDSQFDSYKDDDNTAITSTVAKNNVLSQPYYFLLYLPYNSNLGFLVLQFNNVVQRGIKPAFFDHLKDFFKSRNFNIEGKPFTPRKHIKDYIEKSEYRKIEVIQTKRSKDLSSVEGELQTVNVKHTISGFKIAPSAFNNLFMDKQSRNALLKEVADITFDENYDRIKVTVSDGTTPRGYDITDGSFILNTPIPEGVIIENSKDSIDNLYKFAKNALDEAIADINKNARK